MTPAQQLAAVKRERDWYARENVQLRHRVDALLERLKLRDAEVERLRRLINTDAFNRVVRERDELIAALEARRVSGRADTRRT